MEKFYYLDLEEWQEELEFLVNERKLGIQVKINAGIDKYGPWIRWFYH